MIYIYYIYIHNTYCMHVYLYIDSDFISRNLQYESVRFIIYSKTSVFLRPLTATPVDWRPYEYVTSYT